jgi:hypothetical protein
LSASFKSSSLWIPSKFNARGVGRPYFSHPQNHLSLCNLHAWFVSYENITIFKKFW